MNAMGRNCVRDSYHRGKADYHCGKTWDQKGCQHIALRIDVGGPKKILA
jgi:hypothetical protein